LDQTINWNVNKILNYKFGLMIENPKTAKAKIDQFIDIPLSPNDQFKLFNDWKDTGN